MPAGSVLLVDDEPSILQALQWNLRRRPYTVTTAASAQEALSALSTQRFDVVLSDHQMPGMTGVDLLVLVAERFPTTSRLLMTGHATLPIALRAVNEGRVSRVLVKPCPAEEILASIDDAYRQSQLLVATSKLADVVRAEPVLTATSSRSAAPAPDTSERPSQRGARPSLGAPATFSKREREVFEHLARGQRTNEIAEALFVSQYTIRNHLKAMFRKAGVHSQRDLVALARRKR